MPILTVTANGQVALPKDLLNHMGVRPGQGINVERLPNGRLEVRAAAPPRKVSALFNRLKRRGGPVLSVGKIGAIAAKGWAGPK